jgi:hypothetical protein
VVLLSVAAPSKFARKDDQHIHGPERCVMAFLGEQNWSANEGCTDAVQIRMRHMKVGYFYNCP